MMDYFNNDELPDISFELSSCELHFCSQCDLGEVSSYEHPCPTQVLAPEPLNLYSSRGSHRG